MVISNDLLSCDTTSSIGLPGARIDSSLSLDQVADPDYRNHPAYGHAFPPASAWGRLKAICHLLPWLAFAMVKQLLLGDRLSALANDGDGLEGGLLRRLLALPRYMPLWLKEVATGLRTKVRGEVSMAGQTLPAQRLLADGIVTARFSPSEVSRLRNVTSGYLADLVAKREMAASTSFKGNQQVFTKMEHASVYEVVTEIFSQHGLLEAASAYLGREVQLKRLLLQVNDRRDEYLYNCFPDVGLGNSGTNYMHIDRGYGSLKCIIYLNKVDECNGPFCYVLGSNRLKLGFCGGLIRRAVDRAGLAACNREIRRTFMALPAALRKKGEFGSDILDGSENSKRLLKAEFRFTSRWGNVAVFDNLGIHRGALVEDGQRIALFAVLT
jgi:hypothetical protein